MDTNDDLWQESIEFTQWTSKTATAGTRRALSWPELIRLLEEAPAVAAKLDCPMLALTLFSGPRSKANAVESTGAEIDYDGEQVSIDDAADQLRRHGIRCVLYSSYSDAPGAPRWRVIAPFSGRLPIAQRARMVARVAGTLWGIAAPESFDAGRAYFMGRAPDADYKVIVVDGDGCACVDELDDLDEIARLPEKATATAPAGVALPAPEATTLSAREIEDIRAALHFVGGVDDYEQWIRVGMALKSTGAGKPAFELWLEWARQSKSFDPDESRKKWNGFDPKEITVASIFHMAKEGGYNRAKLVGDEIAAKIDAYDGSDEALDEIRSLMATGGIGDATFEKCVARMKKEHGVPVGTMRAGIAAIRKADADEQKKDHNDWADDALELIGRDNIRLVGGMFYVWDTAGVWRPALDGLIRNAVLTTLQGGDAEIYAPSISGITSTVRDQLETWGASPFDAVRGLVTNANNGTVEWDAAAGDWRLRPHRREDYFTWQLPVGYAPELADATGTVFEQCLRNVWAGSPDIEDRITAFEEMLGYACVADARFQRFVILEGHSAGNGKSTLLDIPVALVGEALAAHVQPAKLDSSFQRGHLHRKLVNVVSELPEDAPFPSDGIKGIVSGDRMTAEHKGRDPFEFWPCCTLFMGTNHLPRLTDTSGGMFRRAIILKCENRLDGDDADRDIGAKLRAEMPIIFARAMRAFGKAIQRNAFTIPASSADAVAGWRVETDQALDFINERLSRSPGGTISGADLYAGYLAWTREYGIRNTLTRRGLIRRLLQHGAREWRSNATRGISGFVFAVGAAPTWPPALRPAA